MAKLVIHKQTLGKWGEEIAEKHILQMGYILLDRNVHNQYGEIDLVALKGDIVVFIEVKTRSSLSYGYPEEAITQAKKEHILQAAETYLLSSPYIDYDWQIDVIAVQRSSKGNNPIITHFENAFT